MAESMTKPSGRSADAFLDAIADPQRRADARIFAGIMRNVTGEPPTMWGDSIVGFGRYAYTYASGHSGESCLVGFSPRKAEFSLYLTCVDEAERARAGLLGRLGRHRMGKACLYVKRASDIDLAVLEDLVRVSVDALRRAYPAPQK